MASSLLSGERVVVALFTFRLIYSTSLSHLYESISLSLLFLFALFVEISLESSPSHSSLLNTRYSNFRFLGLLISTIMINIEFTLLVFICKFCDWLIDGLNCVLYRPGASSGVLLGAVSLPGVMFSRLILNSRAVLLNQVGAEGNCICASFDKCIMLYVCISLR